MTIGMPDGKLDVSHGQTISYVHMYVHTYVVRMVTGWVCEKNAQTVAQTIFSALGCFHTFKEQPK
jgi:hypothetical protein